MAERISVLAAERFAQTHDLRQVIIIGLNDTDNVAHVVTYGKSKDDCRLAAESGNNLKRHMGWPVELCSAVPRRLMSKKQSIIAPETESH